MKVEEHVAKARHNEEFLDQCDLPNSDFLDWAVTVISYSALHYVDAFLAHNFGAHPKDHRERSSHIYQQSALRLHIRDGFEDLKNDGVDARYTSRVFTTQEVTDDIRPLLEEIKNYVGKFVKIT